MRTGASTDARESHRVLVKGMGQSNVSGHTGPPLRCINTAEWLRVRKNETACR